MNDIELVELMRQNVFFPKYENSGMSPEKYLDFMVERFMRELCSRKTEGWFVPTIGLSNHAVDIKEMFRDGLFCAYQIGSKEKQL